MAVIASRPRLPGALWYMSVQMASVSSGVSSDDPIFHQVGD